MKMTQQTLNQLLIKCEPMINRATAKIPRYMRDEVKQEMRIKIWRLIDNKYEGDCDVQDFVLRCIGSIYHSSRNTVGSLLSKNQRFLPLEAAHLAMVEPEVHAIRFSKEKTELLETLMQCLNEHEKFILRYMIVTGNVGPNYDMLMRQLGYTGKGSVKYILDGIKTKMIQFAKEKGIEIDF